MGMPMAAAGAQALIHGGAQGGSGGLGHSAAANPMLSPAGPGGVLDHSQVCVGGFRVWRLALRGRAEQARAADGVPH